MVSPSLHRIVATYRLAAEDPKTLFPPFERKVDDFLQEVPPEDLHWILEHTMSEDHEDPMTSKRRSRIRSKLMGAIHSTVGHNWEGIGRPLFQAIIQTYELPSKLRVKIEAASRFYTKTRRPSLPRESADLVEGYQKLKEMKVGFLLAAKEAIRSGKAHQEGGTQRKVGKFTLINTGGFSDEVMDNIADLTAKAGQALQRKGLGKVCYGDISITKTLTQASTVAFYMLAKDELFVRANVPKGQDTLQTILHELGHRMEEKFLKGKSEDIKRMYAVIGNLPKTPKPPDPEEKIDLPKKGDSITIKGETVYVIRIDYSPRTKGGFKIFLDLDPAATRPKMLTTPRGYVSLQSGEMTMEREPYLGPFITSYAQKGGPSENFAEMFAFYCMDQLPKDQAPLLEAILF